MITKVKEKTKEDMILVGQFINAYNGKGSLPDKIHIQQIESTIVREMYSAEKSKDGKKAANLRELLLKVHDVYGLND